MSEKLKVSPISSLDSEFSVPGDKSLSHRVAILAGLAKGTSKITNFLPSEDCLNTLRAMEALGAKTETLEETEAGPTSLRIHGTAGKLHAPSGPIDCGNSGTGMRLLAGVLAAQPFASTLTGDSSLSGRPMGRIISPLTEMGAKITAKGDKPGCAPLHIEGQTLRATRYEMPMASAQVKSAVLLAGLFAPDRTTVIQPATTRDHTERLANVFKVKIRTVENEITIYGGQIPEAADFAIPGDFSSAAFWLVAAAALPGSRLLIKDVGLNPTRTALLTVLIRMGAEVRDFIITNSAEPRGDIEIRGAQLHGTEILASEIPNLIDEIPILAVAAALAEGTTTIRHAAELRVKETDRISTVANALAAMGARVKEYDDGMEIQGTGILKGAKIQSHGDHRIAMAFAVAGLLASSGDTVIEDTACIRTSYPNFADHLALIQKGS